MKNLKHIFEPQSIAIIGATAKAGAVGNAILINILESGFKGAVYPVNPKYENIRSLKTYDDVTEIIDTVDLAIICIPPTAVECAIAQCAKKGIKAVVLITAGFKEIGAEGKKLEDAIIYTAKKYNIDLIGPNCLGIVNTSNKIKLNANFSFKMPHSGNIALVSQSGAIGVVAIDYAHQQDLGISKFASIGNKAVIDECDVLDYLIHDDETKIITMYIEDISNPKRFFEMAKKAALNKKPIIVIKTGVSARGAVAAHSHTGALSSSDTAYDALFKQCGVIRVTTLEELFEIAKGFTCLVETKGNRVAILTNGGGMGIIATDAVEKYHLEMTTFDANTLDAFKKVLPATASFNNPVDIVGDADAKRFSDALEIIVKDKNVDAIIVSVTPTIKTDMNAIASVLCNYAQSNPKIPILANLLSFEAEPTFIQLLEKENIPNFDFPEINVRALAVMANYYSWLKLPQINTPTFKVNKELVETTFTHLKKERRDHLTEPESYAVLEAYGMKSLEHSTAKTIDEALVSASKIGYPVVLKIVSPDIMHKIDVGGVKINLKNEDDLKSAYTEITKSVKSKKPEANIHGFLIEKMFSQKGIETIVGIKSLKGFGHLIMFGLGGTFVELYKDVSFRLAPLSKQDAMDMITETKGYQILKGYRGQATYDIEAIVDCLLHVSQLVIDFPIIKEMDMNPIIVLEAGKGAVVMDAKLVCAEQPIAASGDKMNKESLVSAN
ncbi:MAG: acetate--CoA ligase family protein [Bacteroidia bacterium]